MKPEAALCRRGRHLKKRYDIMIPLQVVLVGWNLIRRWRIKRYGDDDNKVKIETEKTRNENAKRTKTGLWSVLTVIPIYLRFGRTKQLYVIYLVKVVIYLVQPHWQVSNQ